MPPMATLSTAAYRPRWGLGTALAYLGALTVLVADNWGLYRLGHEHRWAGAFLSIGLAVAFLVVARILILRGELLAGGLAALLAATALPWFVAAIEQLDTNLGLANAFVSFYSPGLLLLHQPHGTESGWIGLDFVALLVALWFLVRYRFPLLAVPAVFAIWFLGQDIAARGTNDVLTGATPGRSAAAAFVVAAVLLGFGLLLDRWGWRREALWPHLGAGLSVVQALTVLVTKYNPDAVAGTALGLGILAVLLAIGIARSSYGVIGGVLVLV
ncbi:MAG: hypothetical protein QOE29_972, partial [Gaiellaceae bacterium]|nr:hypothetical protein [Gaiellaceae bacterium]